MHVTTVDLLTRSMCSGRGPAYLHFTTFRPSLVLYLSSSKSHHTSHIYCHWPTADGSRMHYIISSWNRFDFPWRVNRETLKKHGHCLPTYPEDGDHISLKGQYKKHRFFLYCRIIFGNLMLFIQWSLMSVQKGGRGRICTIGCKE